MGWTKVACWNDGAIEDTVLRFLDFLALLRCDRILAISLDVMPQPAY